MRVYHLEWMLLSTFRATFNDAIGVNHVAFLQVQAVLRIVSPRGIE